MTTQGETIDLLIKVNSEQHKALRKFVRWYERYEREWSADEYLASDEYLDLRDAYDAAKAMVSKL